MVILFDSQYAERPLLKAKADLDTLRRTYELESKALLKDIEETSRILSDPRAQYLLHSFRDLGPLLKRLDQLIEQFSEYLRDLELLYTID